MTDRQTIVEAIRQMIEGQDYTPLERLIADLTPDQAVLKPAGSPYSIATLAWHTWYWNNFWMIAIRGVGDPTGGLNPHATWPEVAAEDWPGIRSRLAEVLDQSRQLAEREDLDRITWRDQTVGTNLLQIAIHSAYHIGQITLLRQELGLWPPAGGE